MKQVRAVERVLRAYTTVEGGGVRLHRAFGYYEMPQFDPFLMLDDFHSGTPEDYLAGFPLHPHRVLRPLPTCLRGPWIIKTAGERAAASVQGMSNG